MVKSRLILLVCFVTALLSGCGGLPGDPIIDDLYTKNVYPGADSTYNIGAVGNEYNNLYVDNINGASASPAFGNINYQSDIFHRPSSVTVTNGTITSGNVSSTQYSDDEYLVVQETGQFIIELNYNDMANDPAVFDFKGRYEGNPAHEVELQFWNYNTSSWDNANSTINDFPSSFSDSELTFLYPADSSNYRDGLNSSVRIIHTSSAVSSHYFYIDSALIEQKSYILAAVGNDYVMDGLANGESLNITLNGIDGEITIIQPGYYYVAFSWSLAGSPGILISTHLFINGVLEEYCGVSIRLNESGLMESSSASYIVHLDAGDILTLMASSTMDNSYIALGHLNFIAMYITQ